MSDEDKIKKSIGYKPNIAYEEDYYSNYKAYEEISTQSEYTNILHDDNNYDNTIMEGIQNNIDFLVQLITNLPLELQTPINQVFKPIFLDWHNNLKNKKYPIKIPEPGGIIIPRPTPRPIPTPTPIPIPAPDPPLSIPDPEFPDPIIGKPKPLDEKPEDDFYIPDPITFVPGDRQVVDEPEDRDGYTIDDDLFTPASPIDVEYVEVDPIEVIEAEFTKNMADLYNHYTNKLKDTIMPYYLHLTTMLMHSTTDSEVQFAYGKINMDNCEVSQNSRHLMDMSLRSEVLGQMKLSYFENLFSLESTIYHLNSFTTMYNFRLRYAKESKDSGADNLSSINNRILSGMAEMYDAKYDNAYINLYKYLTSSTSVLADTFSTMTSGMSSKEAIIRKKEIKDIVKEEEKEENTEEQNTNETDGKAE